ncbi:MAG: NAD(P)-dependent oxidoreductase [Candidatus Marinimicrobia bacterium]|jgi:L-threonate 2-dehydrogenase|nr:NAD(P)-dependent oxidoreductase [Candidatus Neomarinimicrobiota bacterium]
MKIMENIGVIGLGNMGMGIAKNVIKNGYKVTGYDLREACLKELVSHGGEAAVSVDQVGQVSDVVFVMVMNGNQVKDVVTQLSPGMKDNGTIIITATITPEEIKDTYKIALENNIKMIDSPVSGGLQGAHDGTLTLMTAAENSVFKDCERILKSISKNTIHVSQEIGAGQTVKASLQAFIGATFTAIFESLVLGSKAGIDGKILYDVFSTSGVSSPLFKNCAKLIMDRKFENTGSHISTMYKDLGISMDMAKKNGVPMFTAGAAFELFQAGISMYPEGDNWSIVKLLEQMAGTEVKW